MTFQEALKRAVELVPKGGYVGIQTEQNLSGIVEPSVKADLIAGGHMAFQGRLFWLMRSYRVVEAVLVDQGGKDNWAVNKPSQK